LSLQSDQEFWQRDVPRARERLVELLSRDFPAEVAYRRPRSGFVGPLLLDWISADGLRVLSLDLREPDEPLALDYFFKTLADAKTRALTISLRHPTEQVSLIVQCLEAWILKVGVEQELEATLERYVQGVPPA
jgi:hypothetical protein